MFKNGSMLVVSFSVAAHCRNADLLIVDMPDALWGLATGIQSQYN